MKTIDNPNQIRQFIKQYKIGELVGFDVFYLCHEVFYTKRELIIQENKASHQFVFLVSGSVRVYSYAQTGHTISKDQLKPLAILGEAGSLWGKMPSANVEAETDCICLTIDLLENKELLLNDVAFLRLVSKTLASRLNKGINPYVPFENRLSEFILQNSKQDYFTYNLTEMAALLNISYRHLLRTLKTFCAKGVLQKEKDQYKIKDRDYLTQLAEGSR